MVTLIRRAAAGLAIALCCLAIARAAPAPAPYRVIVNPANASNVIERKFLVEAFLKKTTRWPNGELIRPVDLPSESSVRRRFTDEVLGRSVAAVKSYWQQLIFTGRAVPPPEMDADEEVVKFVSKYSGAVGYVSGSIDLVGVKAIQVR